MVADDIIDVVERAKMKKGGLAELRTVAKEYLFGRVFDHCLSDHVFFFKAIVNFPVAIHRPSGEERDIGVEILDHFLGVVPYEHRSVQLLYATARRVCGDIVFRKQGKGVDAVRDHAYILKFGQIFRDKESGGRTVKEDQVAVFDQLDRRKSDLFLLKAVFVYAKGEAREEIIIVVKLRAAVRTGYKPFLLEYVQFSSNSRGADE